MHFNTQNAGYDIIERIMTPCGSYVRGKRGCDKYVTWYTKNGLDFYFGNYFNGINAEALSKLDLLRRVRDDFNIEIYKMEERLEEAEG